MSGSPAPDTRPGLLRPVPLAALAVICIVGGFAWYNFSRHRVILGADTAAPRQAAAPTPAPAPVPTSAAIAPATPTPGTLTPATPPLATPTPAASTASTAPAAATTPPSPPRFDIARIGPDGTAVIAGRAQPGASVTILDGDRPIGEAKADSGGSFAFVPSAPLPPGTRELHLSERAASGQDLQGTEQLVLVIPPRADAAGQPPLAVLNAPGSAPKILQGPPATTPSALGLGVVDYDAAGDTSFAGTAPPGARLRAYVDNQPVGDATADPAGHWDIRTVSRTAAGEHHLRLDQLAADGQVTARVDVPFKREAQLVPPAAGQVVVRRGDSLWLLARNVYGHGPRYTAILAANRAEIRSPDLIYPGQVFVMPAPATPAQGVAAQPGSSTASSSSRSR